MLSDDELVELGRCRPSNQIFLTAARAIESAACAERDARIAELERQLQAYEKHGVTCQTFRHFVSEPCAECNSPGRCAKQLEQQLAEARKDAELLDWMIFYSARLSHSNDAECCQVIWVNEDGEQRTKPFGSARDAIRAAIKEQT